MEVENIIVSNPRNSILSNSLSDYISFLVLVHVIFNAIYKFQNRLCYLFFLI